MIAIQNRAVSLLGDHPHTFSRLKGQVHKIIILKNHNMYVYKNKVPLLYISSEVCFWLEGEGKVINSSLTRE